MRKISFLLIAIVAFIFVSYDISENTYLSLMLVLFPYYILYCIKLKKGSSNKFYMYGIWLSIIQWFLLNTYLHSLTKPVLNFSVIGEFRTILNAGIIIFVNMVIYFSFFFFIYKYQKTKNVINDDVIIKKSKVVFFIVLFMSFLIYLSLKPYASAQISYHIPQIIICIVLYSYFLLKAFTKSQALLFNLILSISPVVYVLSSYMMLFLFIKEFYCYDNCLRPLYGVCFTYLLYCQILTVSTLLLMNFPQKFLKKDNSKIYKIFLFALIFAGSVYQFIYFNKLIY